MAKPGLRITKTIIPFALVGYEVIITNSCYALVGYFMTSYPTPAHGIIVIYFTFGLPDYVRYIEEFEVYRDSLYRGSIPCILL